ncbi:hypothetical protein RESH_02075 [Rhodopirellula europaea SH398]|uniref:Uncharacterized protein n=1 Tax=Rhodopirellula europaea SH398 TaxID=1263868 RepID=M5S6T5_9BACT|nr:hypothetical protein RESH_02075 [Rhodopirellula europaea SH398]
MSPPDKDGFEKRNAKIIGRRYWLARFSQSLRPTQSFGSFGGQKAIAIKSCWCALRIVP